MSIKNLFHGRSTRFECDYNDEYSENVDAVMRNHFLALVGATVDYYGADGGENEFKIDDVIFKVIEDPDDGYRSHLGTIEYSKNSKGIFFGQAIATVRIEEYDNSTTDIIQESQMNQGYRLVDVDDNHVWLIFGTHNYNDYYPCFVFSHFPKKR